jgi:acyl-CoA synthetase (AMP-forming)/AMP-acid ligase II
MNNAEFLNFLPTRISDIVDIWATRSPDRLALMEVSGDCSFSELAKAVAETKAWLTDCGVRPGDRLMIVCENCKAFVAVLMAASKLDAWPVLVNARLSAPEVDKIREHCGARRVIYTTSVSPHAVAHSKRHGATIQHLERLGAIAIGPLTEDVSPEVNEADPRHNVAAMIYTSGTTGVPKGVMLSHRNLLFIAAVSAEMRSLTPDDCLYGVLPMSHAVGLSVVLLGSLLHGASVYLAPRFDPARALPALQEGRITVMLGGPSMFSLLLDYAKLKGMNSAKFPRLRVISSAGAPLQPPVKSAVEDFFGMVLHNGYGVTECSPNIASTRIETPRSDVSVGKIMRGIEIKLVDYEGEPVPDGEVGELWVRGPNIMKGYYHAPEETAAAVNPKGWFNTRDLAKLEGDHLFIEGRTKELIVRFGLNVYPAEVEAVLNSHPAVLRSAVLGRNVAGNEGGEDVIAFVQLRPGASAAEVELAQHAAHHLAPYKRPSQIQFVPDMPLTPTGKVIKGELSKLAEPTPTT